MNTQKKSILNLPVLVLNSNWAPVNVTIVRDAVGVVFKGSADVIVHEDLKDKFDKEVIWKYDLLDYELWVDYSEMLGSEQIDFLRSGRSKHFRPKIIKLTKFKNNVHYYIKLSRKGVYNRDGGRCQYCGKHVDRREFTIDHIQPKCRGGQTTWNNIVTCCKPCNAKKDDLTLHQCGMKLLKKPVKPDATNFQEIYSDEYAVWKDFLKGAK